MGTVSSVEVMQEFFRCRKRSASCIIASKSIGLAVIDSGSETRKLYLLCSFQRSLQRKDSLVRIF